MTVHPDEPPIGFQPIPRTGFSAAAAMIYWRMLDGEFQLGFRVTPDQCNGMGHCHGGMMATLLDMQLALGARAQDRRVADHFLPTISLQVDYLGSASLGSWVSGKAEVLKVTHRMVFVQGTARSDDTIVARASACMKIGGDARGSKFDIGAWLRAGQS